MAPVVELDGAVGAGEANRAERQAALVQLLLVMQVYDGHRCSLKSLPDHCPGLVIAEHLDGFANI